MKTSIQQTGFFKSAGRKLSTHLAFAMLACTMFAAPAMAQHDDNRGHGDDHGRADYREMHNDHGRDHDRERYRDRDRRYGHDDRRWRGQEQPYYYAQPVYVPPTVYVEPEPSAGISIFLPIRLRH